MQSKLNPYINFKDNAREAMDFYKTVFGGKLDINTFGDYHMSDDPSEADKVMHSVLEADNGITFMAADTPNSLTYEPGKTITMALNGDNDDELSAYYEKLAAGGKVIVPLNNAPWGDKFGMVVDKFGVQWLVNVAGKKE